MEDESFDAKEHLKRRVTNHLIKKSLGRRATDLMRKVKDYSEEGIPCNPEVHRISGDRNAICGYTNAPCPYRRENSNLRPICRYIESGVVNKVLEV